MKRAVGRAYQRLKGEHPRRPKSKTNGLVEVACDLLLGLAALGMIGGLALLLWATVSGLHPAKLLGGAAAIGLGAGLLLLWERIVWEPAARALARRLDELS